MISEFVDRQAANADLYELEDVLTGEKRQYRIVSKATVTVPGTDLNKATFDPILSGLQSIGEFEKMAVLIDDWNAVTENGIYMANGGANAPVSGEWHMGLVMHHNNAYSVQRVCAFASTKKWYERHQMNGSWDAWAEVAGTDFATAGIADSGGSASTGYWVKYDDGTMICWRHQDGMRAINTAVTNTNFYKSDNISLGDFPVSFSAQPAVVVSLYSNAATGVWLSAPFQFSGSSAGNVILYNPTSIPSLLCGLQYIAVGRWK
jgi:hypothetical protein